MLQWRKIFKRGKLDACSILCNQNIWLIFIEKNVFIIFVIKPDTPHVLQWRKKFQKGKTCLSVCFVQSKYFFENVSYYVITHKCYEKEKNLKETTSGFSLRKKDIRFGSAKQKKKQKQIWNKLAWYILFIMIWQ